MTHSARIWRGCGVTHVAGEMGINCTARLNDGAIELAVFTAFSTYIPISGVGNGLVLNLP
ncbi:Uncharacterised protein [Yersinia frederiksenii]|nr:Uncharacterised protein [Yersinia frederiksenii]